MGSSDQQNNGKIVVVVLNTTILEPIQVSQGLTLSSPVTSREPTVPSVIYIREKTRSDETEYHDRKVSQTVVRQFYIIEILVFCLLG